MPTRNNVNAPDVLLSVILAKDTLAVGDGVSSNDKPYLTTMPYLALAWEDFTSDRAAGRFSWRVGDPVFRTPGG